MQKIHTERADSGKKQTHNSACLPNINLVLLSRRSMPLSLLLPTPMLLLLLRHLPVLAQ